VCSFVIKNFYPTFVRKGFKQFSMRKISLMIFSILTLISSSLISQNKDYSEEEVRKLLDKYIENPKLYFEKIKALNERAEKANENTLKVSEEYLSLLDKKDSLIKIYKQKAVMASRVAPATAPSATTATVTTGSPAKPSQQTATIMTKVKGKTEYTPFRVQLAAYFREDFEKFFGDFNKTLGIQKLNNRNVIEVQGFKDEAEALEFSQKIQKLGFPGAFVTKYDENGERQEGFATKSDTKLFSGGTTASAAPAAPTKTSKSIQYPDYIPVGYKEHMNKQGNPPVVAKAAPAAPNSNPPAAPAAAPKAKSSEPVKLKAPSIQPDAILSSTPTPPVPAVRPRAIASAAPIPSAEESAARPAAASPAPKASTPPPPPVNKNTRDQLDAAFDQLFKR
jgi:hypothetical protein